MSALDATCFPIRPEIVVDNGAGEMKCLKSFTTSPPYESGLTNAIASEIINEILDNALDIVLAKSAQLPTEKISPNMVGDILENIMSSSTDSPDETSREDETSLLDDEIKKIIKEMKCPPQEKNLIGVGDQLLNKNEILPQEPKRNTLERKNRLTNLVRNSKQMLSKFVTGENDEREVKYCKSEETHEKLLKIIDLETASENKTGDFCAPGSCRTAPEALHFPFDSALDVVDLENKTKTSEDDEQEREIGSCMLDKDEKKPTHKKKWNFATKIMKYLKKKEKSEQSSSTKKE